MNRNVRSWRAAVLLGGALALAPSSAPAAELKGVEVTGQPNPTNQYREFLWTVRNRGNSPIVSLRVPAFLGGGLIMPPEGWSGQPSHADIGEQGKLSVVEFRAESPAAAIRAAETKVFEARIHADYRWQPVQCVVAVGLASGEELLIADVTCPLPESFIRRNVPALGLGAIFGIYVAVTIIRRRRRPAPTQSPSA